MDKVNSTTIPKVVSNLQSNLIDIEFIKLNITLSENTINQQIYDLFSILIGQE